MPGATTSVGRRPSRSTCWLPWPTPSATCFRTLANRSLTGLLALILLASPLDSPASHEPERLSALIEQGRFDEAYALARSQFNQHAGEPMFDLQYGLVAVETGNLNEAIFALERVLIRAPGFDRARLELARALYLQEDDLRARRQFEIVLSHDPPQAVVSRIERYLAALDRRADRFETRVTGWLEAGAGLDDNVNRAPNTDSVDLGFGTLFLSEDQQERDSEFVSASGGVQLSRPLLPGLNLIAGFDAQARSISNEKQFDTRFARGRVGLRKILARHEIQGFFEAHRFYVGGDPYQDAGRISLSYGHELDSDTALHSSISVQQLEYDTQEVRDAQLSTISVGASQSWSARFNPRARVTLTLGEEDPDSNSVQARALAGRDIEGLGAWLGLSLTPEWSLQSTLRYRRSEYETRVFPFPEAREEDYYGLEVSLDWHPDAHWQAGPYVDYSENEANIELYDYERTVVGLRARYTFF